MSVNNTLENLTVRDSSLNLRCESLICNNVITPTGHKVDIEYIQQSTAGPTSPVNGTKQYSIITMAPQYGVINSVYLFQYNNPLIKANGAVRVNPISIDNNYGLSGVPVFLVSNILDGQCLINTFYATAINFPPAKTIKIFVEIIIPQ